MLEYDDLEFDLVSQPVYGKNELTALEEDTSLALEQSEYLVLEILDEVQLVQPDYLATSPIEAVVLDSAFMEEVSRQAFLMYAAQYEARLPEPIRLFPGSGLPLRRPAVHHHRKRHLGGLTTLG